MKKILIIFTLLFAGVLFIRFVLGGPEDTWLCQNGEWIKHGNPKAPMPNEICKKTYELYWSEGCPHCKNVETFLNIWEKKDSVKIKKYEVQNNQTNANLMLQRAKTCGINTTKELSVPLLYMPGSKCLNSDTSIIEYFKSL